MVLSCLFRARKDVDPMQSSTSPRRKSFKLLVLSGSLVSGLGFAVALLTGITPATAASIVQQPDAQVAVFMVPLTILLAALLFEVARLTWRGKLPAERRLPARRRQHWSPGQGEG